jgi:hypothetical protein
MNSLARDAPPRAMIVRSPGSARRRGTALVGFLSKLRLHAYQYLAGSASGQPKR